MIIAKIKNLHTAVRQAQATFVVILLVIIASVVYTFMTVLALFL